MSLEENQGISPSQNWGFALDGVIPVEGVATWSIEHSLGADAEVQVREAASGELVLVGIKATVTGCDVTINSDAVVTAGTYKAVVMG